MARTKKQPADSNRQFIIDTARNLIMNQGVKGTSIADIAREAGISKGTLSYYFPVKNDLIFDVTDQHFQQVTNTLMKTMLAHCDTDPRETFRMGFTGIINEATRGQLNLYLVQDAVTGNEELKERFRGKYAEWRQSMQELLLNVFPEGNEQTHKLYSYILVAALDGLIIQWLLDPNEVPITEIADCLAETLSPG